MSNEETRNGAMIPPIPQAPLNPSVSPATSSAPSNNYRKLSLWVAITTLALGGLLTAGFIVAQVSGDVVWRAVFTLVLLAGFAFASLGESSASERRQSWVTTSRIGFLVLTLLAGLWHIWAPQTVMGYGSNYYIDPGEFYTRFFLFLLTIAAFQLASGAVSLLGQRARTRRIPDLFVRILGAGVVLFTVAMTMFSVGVTFTTQFLDGSPTMNLYWRIFSALLVLSVVIVLIALISRAFVPAEANSALARPSVPHYAQQAEAPLATPPAIAPGWYKTEDGAHRRYHDGRQWTQFVEALENEGDRQ